jgi:protein gp37
VVGLDFLFQDITGEKEMSKTKIAWTDETANWIVGCSKVSAGCRSCYAATAANSARLQQFDQYKAVVDGNGNWNGNIEFVPKVLDGLLKGKRSRRVFAPSMSDPFHHNVKEEWLDQFIATAIVTPHIQYQVLTKRAKGMHEYFENFDIKRLIPFVRKTSDKRHDLTDYRWKLPIPNLHLGVSVENQAAADDRIPWLIKTPAVDRFLSCEPLLEDINLAPAFVNLTEQVNQETGEKRLRAIYENTIIGPDEKLVNYGCTAPLRKNGISQVIIGGESGPNARPFNLEWARSLRDQCKEAGVKYFFKQAGSNVWDKCPPPAHLADLGLITESYCQLKLRDRKGGDLSEIPEDLRIREIL